MIALGCVAKAAQGPLGPVVVSFADQPRRAFRQPEDANGRWHPEAVLRTEHCSVCPAIIIGARGVDYQSADKGTNGVLIEWLMRSLLWSYDWRPTTIASRTVIIPRRAKGAYSPTSVPATEAINPTAKPLISFAMKNTTFVVACVGHISGSDCDRPVCTHNHLEGDGYERNDQCDHE